MLPDSAVPRSDLSARARAIRSHVVAMASGRGEGYVGQGLGISDVLAALYFGELNYRADDPNWDGRDRFILSTGHYAIGLYGALAEAGVLPHHRLKQYALDGDELPASTHHEVPGVESTTGSLAQGLSLAVGMAIAARWQARSHRVFVLMSDGELQEGSTWEAAMLAGHLQLSNIVALVDLNNTQADGPLVVGVEPVTGKFAAFGWRAQECDGNDAKQLGAALVGARTHTDQPQVIVCRTRLGAGVPVIEDKQRAHFVRVEADEWAVAAAQLGDGADLS